MLVSLYGQTMVSQDKWYDLTSIVRMKLALVAPSMDNRGVKIHGSYCNRNNVQTEEKL